MHFGNVAAFCKCWYEYRGGVDKMWMDMIHCIDADGWTLETERDVALWCLHRLDELREDPLFTHKHQLDLGYFFNEVFENQRRAKWYYNMELSTDSAIIQTYRDIISNTERKCFDSGVKPNENVLPLSYHDAWYDDGKYSNGPKLYPRDMHEDVIKRIEESFGEYKEQDIEDGRFEEVEARIRHKSYKDVVVLIGTDSLLDCEEAEMTGKEIVKKHYNDECLNLDIYSNCDDIDSEKTYVLRIAKKRIWDEYYEYAIKSIKEKV